MSILNELSSPFSRSSNVLAIVLAAGHGKRIKSDKSKMLHEIWGEPTVERVCRAVRKGLRRANLTTVVGVKAESVAQTIGRTPQTRYAYQEEQNGTGHAVQVALEHTPPRSTRYCYVLPGDMGLLTPEELKAFHQAFTRSKCDMMVLTGMYHGDPQENYYGRIVRAKEHTSDGKRSAHAGMVIEIKEHRDILALEKPYTVTYRGEHFHYTREELLGIREFNSGVYGFRMKPLLANIGRIGSENAQGELYLTDLIAMFNQKGLKVGARPATDTTVVLGFNNKSVLKEMDAIARSRVYERLKDIATFDDPDNFFLADEVVEQMEKLDRAGRHLDMQIGQGAYVGAEVNVNVGLRLGRNATVTGRVRIGQNARIGEGCTLATYPGQTLTLGDNVEILAGNQLNGCITLKDGARIEANVRITGSDDHPTCIGRGVRIKGASYLFGCSVEDGVLIEHCFMKGKRVRAVRREDGSIQPVRFYHPMPEGLDSVVEP